MIVSLVYVRRVTSFVGELKLLGMLSLSSWGGEGVSSRVWGNLLSTIVGSKGQRPHLAKAELILVVVNA